MSSQEITFAELSKGIHSPWVREHSHGQALLKWDIYKGQMGLQTKIKHFPKMSMAIYFLHGENDLSVMHFK